MTALDKVHPNPFKALPETSLGSIAEIQAMRMPNEAHCARQDAAAFSTCVKELFKADRYENFRAKVEDIELTVSKLNTPKVSQPAETMASSLLTVRHEITAMIVAVDKKPDPRLALVVSAFSDLERSCTALALQEQKRRKISAAVQAKNAIGSSLLRTLKLPSPFDPPSPHKKMVLGLG